MITKNEEENIMNEAIGSMISDYLIKPLNPNQLLISIKKVLQNSELVSEKIKVDYLNFFNDFNKILYLIISSLKISIIDFLTQSFPNVTRGSVPG